MEVLSFVAGASVTGFSPAVINRTGAGAAFTISGRGLSTADVVQLRVGATACPVDPTSYPLMLNQAPATVNGTPGARTLVVTADGVTGPSVTAGYCAVCVKFSGTSVYVQVGVSQLAVAEAVVADPRGMGVLSGRVVRVTGVAMTDVSGDASGFVLASGDCATPNSVMPASVGSITSAWTSDTSITLTVNAGGLAGGTYKVCVRWLSSSVYSEAASGVSPLSVGECKRGLLGVNCCYCLDGGCARAGADDDGS